jgi:hypothetical protein
MLAGSSPDTGLECPTSATSPGSTGEASSDPTSSAAGSPARTSRSRAGGRGLRARGAGSGTSSPAPFVRFDPDSCSWRTWQLCLFGGWMPFSGRWPRSGMMRNGTAYRLQPLVPRISATGSSYWHTPNAADAWVPSSISENTLRRGGGALRRTTGSLAKQAASPRYWPTPSTTDHKGSYSPGQRRRQLSEAVQDGGKLNPTWVEWLMGFPPDWTDCAASATPSSPRSPNGSGG